jgi:predicted metalloprotease
VIALIVLLGGGLVLAVLIGVVAVLTGGPDDDYTSIESTYTPTPYVSPTYSSYTSTPWTPSPEESTPEEADTPDPEETETTPPKPQGPPPETVLKQNKLYSAGSMRSVGCRESGTPPSSQENARIYYNQIFGCLNRAWAPVVKRAGYKFQAPEVITWAGSIETPCGDYVRAFYCGTNDTIYMKWDDDVNQYNKFPESYQKVYARMFTTFQASHEYGHHVQWMVGIGPAYNQLWDQTSDQLELSRRLELQASCFAGVFDGANQPSYPITGEARYQWMYLVDHYGDEYGERRDHGSRKNHGPWSKGSFKSENPKSCNTWSASSARVS